MNSKDLKELLESLQATDIEELRFKSGAQKVYFKKGELPVAQTAVNKREEQAKKDAAEEAKIKPIKAPMVGTFYHSQSSDHPPFIVDGENVTPGQKVGIIETMKIIKDVNSNLKGKIIKVSVKNGQSVEYGQELFLVDTGEKKKNGNGNGNENK